MSVVRRYIYFVLVELSRMPLQILSYFPVAFIPSTREKQKGEGNCLASYVRGTGDYMTLVILLNSAPINKWYTASYLPYCLCTRWNLQTLYYPKPTEKHMSRPACHLKAFSMGNTQRGFPVWRAHVWSWSKHMSRTPSGPHKCTTAKAWRPKTKSIFPM